MFKFCLRNPMTFLAPTRSSIGLVGPSLTHSLPMSEILNSILNDVRSSRNFQDNLIMLCQDDLGPGVTQDDFRVTQDDPTVTQDDPRVTQDYPKVAQDLT